MWNERYSTQEYVYGTLPNEFLIQTSSRIPGHNVLCLAEGEGRNAVYLAREGYNVLAVDASPVGLEKAEILADDSYVNIDTCVADLSDYDIQPEQWDGIVSIFCHLPQDVRQRMHKQVVDGLKPGGKLLLEAYHPRQAERPTGGPDRPEVCVTLHELINELDGLEFEYAKEMDRDVIEGRYHTGIGAVVQVIAKKPE